MTEAQIREQLSIHYVGTLAATQGFKVERPVNDYGVDIAIERMATVTIEGRTRHFSSGQSIDVQLKSTTNRQVERTKEGIKYNLRVQNYNDLVIRYQWRREGKLSYIPLVLMLFVLPDDRAEWVRMTPDGVLHVSGECFWYLPDPKARISKNKTAQRIFIPQTNRVNLQLFNKLFNLVGELTS